MKFGQMFPSNYLKKEDFPSPRLFTIKQLAMEEIQGDHGKEIKPVMYFADVEKGMVLNKGNGETCAEAFGEETDGWAGKRIEVYCDPSVSFGGKRVGGIRLRVPSQNGTVNGWVFAQALAELEKAGITKEAFVARQKAKGFASYNAERDTPTVKAMIAEVSGMPDYENQNQDSEIPF